MHIRRSLVIALIAIASGAGATTTLALKGAGAELAAGQDDEIRPDFKPAKLLDFASYKHLFGKHYQSPAEETNRKRNFFPRSLRSFVSSVKYKFGRASSYTSINQMSDWTPEELERARNKAIEHLEGRPVAGAASNRQLPSISSNPLESIKWSRLMPAPSDRERDQMQPIWAQHKKLERGERKKLPNQVFVDHRKSNCLNEPRSQGKCGSCYAFAAMTLMEWLLCKQTGRRAEPLSEQFMIDCGAGRYENRLGGCQGGSADVVASFVHQFGLEKLQSFPYKARQDTCPHDLVRSNAPSGATIRMDLSESAIVHQDHWERIVKKAPLWVQIRSPAHFQEYGGGIESGSRCGEKANHIMVLIGHGREDGEQYWLIRNSYGSKWGESGHFKLNKRATAKCLLENGFMFATSDGVNFRGVDYE